MVYQDYRDGSVFSKGDPTVSRGGGGLGSIANSYNYRTFYFPGACLRAKSKYARGGYGRGCPPPTR